MNDKDGPEICIVNEAWFSEDRLLWPPKNLRKIKQSKFLSLVPTSDWLEFTEFVVLKRGIKSIATANDRLNFYCLYENSLDKIKYDAEREERRLHPVRYIETHLDYNSMFDELNEGSTSTPNVSLADKQKNDAALCFLCGLKASIKCGACGTKRLCIDCDNTYHKHPLRTSHIRKKMETPPYAPRPSEEDEGQTVKQKISKCCLCGLEALIKCDSCGAKRLCIECDITYHKHPLRTSHLRKRIEAPSHVYNPKSRPEHENQVQPSTSTRGVNSDGTDDKYMLIPLDREKEKRTTHQKQKNSLNAKSTRKISSSKSIHDVQQDDNNSGELPTLPSVPMKKPSQMIEEASSSNAIGCSNFKNYKETENKGENALSTHEQNTPQHLANVLMREKELQTLSGNANEISENDEQNKQAKTAPRNKNKLLKSSVKRKAQAIALGSSNTKPKANSVDNKACTRVRKVSVVKSSAKRTTPTSSSLNVKVSANSNDIKIAKKIECIESILICSICGSIGDVKCEQCDSVILCVKCDIAYHNHMLRSGHTRQKLDVHIENEKESKVERKTEKPEAVTKTMNSSDNLSVATAPLRQQRRPPPPLLLIPSRNVSTVTSNEQVNNTNIDFSDVNSFKYNEELNNNRRSSLQHEDVNFEVNFFDPNEIRGSVISNNLEGDNIVQDSVREMQAACDVSNKEIGTTTNGTQKGKQPVNTRFRSIKQTNGRSTIRRNPLNKGLLTKMFATIKAMKKDNNEMKASLKQIKRSQTVLRNKLVRANTSIMTLKDLLYVKTPKEQIQVDTTFVLPKLPLESVLATTKLDQKCRTENYCDQLAVRFKNFSATDTNDVKHAIKRIMDYLFTYEHLMAYSWSGKSDLNSGHDEKEKFSILIGIQSMIRKAATVKIHSTPKVESDCIAAIKENVRRASQNYARQNHQ